VFMTRLSPIAIAVVLATQPAVLKAEESVATAEASIEVMSVTGRKVAYANNVTDETAKLAKSPVGNVMDLINNLPGVNVSQGDAFGADDYTTIVTMRGFVIDRADQQLGITVDGIPNGGSAYAGGSKANRYLDAENTQLVEVGQGASDIASASLDALGGTINFVSSNPQAERSAQYGFTRGSFNARRDFIRFDSGEVFGNTTAYASVSDSFNNRWIGTGSNGYSDRLHFEAKSVTELENTKITARLSYDDTHEDNYQPVSLEQFEKTPRWDGLTNVWTGDPDIDQNFAEAWSTLRENTLGYVKAEFTLQDNLALTVTPYLHQQTGRGDWLPPYQHYVTDANGNRVTKGNLKSIAYKYVDSQGRPILDPNADLTGATRVSSYRHTHYDKTRYGTLADLRWELDSHQIRSGMWLEKQDRNQLRDWHAVTDAKIYHYYDEKPYWVQLDDDYTSTVMKYYLQDKISLDDLQITLGVQQYLVDIEHKDLLNGLGQDKIDSDSKLLPSLGVVYQLTDRIELFSGYSQNFKAISDKLLEKKKAIELADLDPETADNLDIGVRYAGESVDISATFYKVKFEDRIALLTYQTNPDGTPNYDAVGDDDYDNIGGVDSTGFEGSFDWRLNEQFNLSGSLTINDSTYSENVLGVKNNPAGKKVEVIEYKSGQEIAGIPRQMLSLSLNYQQDAYRAGIGAKYQGDYFGAAKHTYAGNQDVWNKDKIESHTLWNAYLGYRKELSGQQLFDSLDINFVLNNLTDKEHISGGSEGAYLLGAGRSGSVTISFGF
jgi:iron complex outermembrane recepter protein